MAHRTSIGVILGAALLVTACGRKAPPVVTYPPGTVLAIDDVPITADDVDRWRAVCDAIDPGYTEPHQRRLALTNVVLPTAVAAALDPVAREEARARAEDLLARLSAGETPGAPGDPEAQRITGGWDAVGLDTWWLCGDMAAGDWGGPLEHPGAWIVWQMIERPPGEWRPDLHPTVDLYVVPYLPQEGLRDVLTEAMTAVQLTIVDPAWEHVVPKKYLDDMSARVLPSPADATH